MSIDTADMSAPTTGWSVRARDREDSPTRAGLMTAAQEVFSRKGYALTTVADVTDGAGTGRATFYVYFASKDAVFRALALEVRDRLCAAQAVPADGSPREVLRAAMAAYLATYLDNIGLLRVIAHQAIDDPEVRGLLEEIRAAPTGRHRRFIEHLQSAGEADPVAEPVLVAEAVQGVVERFAELVDSGGGNGLTQERAADVLLALTVGMVRF